MNRCGKYEDAPRSREGIRIEGKLAKDIIINANTIQMAFDQQAAEPASNDFIALAQGGRRSCNSL